MCTHIRAVRLRATEKIVVGIVILLVFHGLNLISHGLIEQENKPLPFEKKKFDANPARKGSGASHPIQINILDWKMESELYVHKLSMTR